MPIAFFMVQHGAVSADCVTALLAEKRHRLVCMLDASFHFRWTDSVERLSHVRNVKVGLKTCKKKGIVISSSLEKGRFPIGKCAPQVRYCKISFGFSPCYLPEIPASVKLVWALHEGHSM